jgi:hypothetical protein
MKGRILSATALLALVLLAASVVMGAGGTTQRVARRNVMGGDSLGAAETTRVAGTDIPTEMTNFGFIISGLGSSSTVSVQISPDGGTNWMVWGTLDTLADGLGLDTVAIPNLASFGGLKYRLIFTPLEGDTLPGFWAWERRVKG